MEVSSNGIVTAFTWRCTHCKAPEERSISLYSKLTTAFSNIPITILFSHSSIVLILIVCQICYTPLPLPSPQRECMWYLLIIQVTPVVMSVMCVKIPWGSVNLKTALKVVVVLNCLPQQKVHSFPHVSSFLLLPVYHKRFYHCHFCSGCWLV